MLILSRKTGESIVIDGRIIVKIVRLEGDIVKLGIEAPASVPVHRQEVYEEIQKNNREALTKNRPKLPRLAANTPATGSAPAVPPAAKASASEKKVSAPAAQK
jgi:carbon storage regulator